MGLIQRSFDDLGLSTISITLCREITQYSKPSRSLLLEYPFGLTFGEPGNQAQQRAILLHALEQGVSLEQPSARMPFVWEKDDLRERQLRKQAH